MQGLGFKYVDLVNTFTIPALNNRIDSFNPTQNDVDLGDAMSRNEVEPGSGTYGWGRNFAVHGVKVTDPVLMDETLGIGCRNLEDLKKLLMDGREVTHKNLISAAETKNAKSLENEQLLLAFEAIYCDENGQLLPPNWEEAVVVIAGHHRLGGACILHCKVLCDTHVENDKPAPKTFSPKVPVDVVIFNSLTELRKTQIEGNSSEMIHNPLSELDQVGCARVLIPSGYNETQFRHLFGEDNGGPARRAFAIAKLDLFFPFLGIFAAMVRYAKAINRPGMTKELKEKVNTDTDVMGIPWAALHINANDPNGNVPMILRCAGPLEDLKKYSERANAKVSDAEREVLNRGKPWSKEELIEWSKTRFPCLNGGSIVAKINKPKKADTDFVSNVLSTPIYGELGAMMSKVVMAETAQERERLPEASFILVNKDSLNSAISLMKSQIGGSFRHLVAELEVAAAGIPVEELSSLVEDFRSQLRTALGRATTEANAGEKTEESAPAKEVEETTVGGKGKAAARAKAK